MNRAQSRATPSLTIRQLNTAAKCKILRSVLSIFLISILSLATVVLVAIRLTETYVRVSPTSNYKLLLFTVGSINAYILVKNTMVKNIVLVQLAIVEVSMYGLLIDRWTEPEYIQLLIVLGSQFFVTLMLAKEGVVKSRVLDYVVVGLMTTMVSTCIATCILPFSEAMLHQVSTISFLYYIMVMCRIYDLFSTYRLADFRTIMMEFLVACTVPGVYFLKGIRGTS
ncbi:hypothetical protein FBU31_000621 [Coemansia sp. 'formosensis']|nr:hypothetical protein FBU31_000621 [Coemansia sp. 'formosensis']